MKIKNGLLSLIIISYAATLFAMEESKLIADKEQLEQTLTAYHDTYKKEHYTDYMHTFFVRLPGKANVIHIAILHNDVAFLQEVLPAIKHCGMTHLLNEPANTQKHETPLQMLINKRMQPQNNASSFCYDFTEQMGKEGDEKVMPLIKLLLDNAVEPSKQDFTLSCFFSTNTIFELLVPKMDKKYLAYVLLNKALPVPLEFEDKPIQLHCDKMDLIKKLLEKEDIEKLAEEYIQALRAKPNPFANIQFTSTPIPTGNTKLNK